VNDRAIQVLNEAKNIVSKNRTPTARHLSKNLDFPQSDVHLCLNQLEKNGDIKTRTKKGLSQKNRVVEIIRK
jgi:DNA-binding IclR family transcriptional regulator